MSLKSAISIPKAFLIDMDGVLVKGDAPIEGAAEFISRLHESRKFFCFLPIIRNILRNHIPRV